MVEKNNNEMEMQHAYIKLIGWSSWILRNKKWETLKSLPSSEQTKFNASFQFHSTCNV
jgi:hypothetical protein